MYYFLSLPAFFTLVSKHKCSDLSVSREHIFKSNLAVTYNCASSAFTCKIY